MKLKDYLTLNKISSGELAKACDIPHPTIISYVNETHEPSLKNALKIVKATMGAVKAEDLVQDRE
jgi:DNA-binding XRE family transcriptional regulator